MAHSSSTEMRSVNITCSFAAAFTAKTHCGCYELLCASLVVFRIMPSKIAPYYALMSYSCFYRFYRIKWGSRQRRSIQFIYSPAQSVCSWKDSLRCHLPDPPLPDDGSSSMSAVQVKPRQKLYNCAISPQLDSIERTLKFPFTSKSYFVINFTKW